jgi:hypothetical protein
VPGRSGFEWQAGAWTPFRAGWVWTPARYYPTPAGWVFVDGYWDSVLQNRGTLYAPVVFNNNVWLTPGWAYRPVYSVSQTAVMDSLFVGPGGRRFVFGDYYGATWDRLGYRPWFRSSAAAPLFSYYRWHHRAEPGWAAGLEHRFRERFEGRVARPAATLAEQHRRLAARRPDDRRRDALRMVGPASRLAHHVRVGAEHRRAEDERRRHLAEAARARAAVRPAARAGVHTAMKLAHHPAARHAAAHAAGHAAGHAAKAAAHHPPPKPHHPPPRQMKPTKMHGGGGGRKKR